MNHEALTQLARILQLSITPVALISGIGLLLLSMTNRLGRVIDRSRVVGAEVARDGDDERRAEARILFRRARLLMIAIALVASSIFLAALMVLGLFVMYLVGANLSGAILVLFALCLIALVASMSCFLGDIILSIRWLRVSLGRIA